jgi:hypothetical protein
MTEEQKPLTIEAIKARRDSRFGKDLSQFELRLDDECLAKHYAEDVTFLLAHAEDLRHALLQIGSMWEYRDAEWDEARFLGYVALGVAMAKGGPPSCAEAETLLAEANRRNSQLVNDIAALQARIGEGWVTRRLEEIMQGE